MDGSGCAGLVRVLENRDMKLKKKDKQEKQRWDDLNVQMGRAKTTVHIHWLIIFPTEVWTAGNKVLCESA